MTVVLVKPAYSQLLKKFFCFVELEDSLPFSQELTFIPILSKITLPI